MNLNEKITKVTELRTILDELKREFYSADRNKNSDEKKRIDKEIRKTEKDIVKVNDEYEKEKNNRNIDEKIREEAVDFVNKGKDIDKLLSEYNESLKIENITDEDKIQLQEEIDKLKEEKENLKKEIYKKALEKSGLKYKEGKIYVTSQIKKEKNKIENLQKEKSKLEEQKQKQEKIAETNRARMEEQFNIATQKYQEMYASEKISKELYESRITNMNKAKEQDNARIDSMLKEIDGNIEKIDKEIESLNNKIKELEEKEKIFDEYNNAYYEIFGETLDTYYMNNKEMLEPGKKVINKEEVVNKPKESQNNKPIENKSREEKNSGNNVEEYYNNIQQPSNIDGIKEEEKRNVSKLENVNEPEKEEVDKKEEQSIVIADKKQFKEIYSKLSKGSISEKELLALTDVLSDEKNYDKFGITTGLVFNKARKILKYVSKKTCRDIESFLKKHDDFSDDVKYSKSVDKEKGLVSHDELNEWNEVQAHLVNSEENLAVEKYIYDIEEYKESGNELTQKQQKTYEEAIGLKERILCYRNALDTSGKVTIKRGDKIQKWIMKNKLSVNTLPSSTSREEIKPTCLEDTLGNLVNDIIESYKEEKACQPPKEKGEKKIEENIK